MEESRIASPPPSLLPSRRPARKFVWLAVYVGLALAVSGWAAVFMVYLQRQTIPPSIAKRLEFKAQMPGWLSGVTIDQASYKYDAADKVFSFAFTTPDGNRAAVTEQAVPDEFADIADAYTKMVSSLGPYLTFDSSFGQVSVCHSQRLGDAEVAVAKGAGTLVFIKTSHPWTESGWRKLFNNLSTP